ncbi:hypothetical protein PMAYCL1PPCAC_17371, partial [Pristionchus mayeri]
MIEFMIQDIHFSLQMVVSPYEKLIDRISIMNELGKGNISDQVNLERLGVMAKHLKESIADLFMETPWLNDTDALDLDRLSQFMMILDEITIMQDFDEFDSNLTLWRSVDQFVASKYSEYKKRTTGCIKFDVIHSFETIKNDLGKGIGSGEDWQLFMRITHGLSYNAFNGFDYNAIVILAPIFYPILWENTSDTTVLAFGAILGHEMFHSFIKSNLGNSSHVFTEETECIVNHFNSSCEVWAESTCKSGLQTFEEDGPDVEGLRVAYDLLRRRYTQEQVKELEYEDLSITQEQAFFYSPGVRFCSASEDDADPFDEHSSDKVRLNAGVSMLPQFTAAFECEKGNEEYSDEASTCYLFGSQSG